MTLREAINKAIEDNHTQRSIALDLGVSEFQLCRWAGGKLPDLEHRRKLNEYFGEVYCEKCIDRIEQLKTKSCVCEE
jgi:hypothetical protein